MAKNFFLWVKIFPNKKKTCLNGTHASSRNENLLLLSVIAKQIVIKDNLQAKFIKLSYPANFSLETFSIFKSQLSWPLTIFFWFIRKSIFNFFFFAWKWTFFKLLHKILTNSHLTRLLITFRHFLTNFSQLFNFSPSWKFLHFRKFSFSIFRFNLHEKRKISFSIWLLSNELSINGTFCTEICQLFHFNNFSFTILLDKRPSWRKCNKEQNGKILRDVERIDFHCGLCWLRMSWGKFSVLVLSMRIYQNKPMKHYVQCFSTMLSKRVKKKERG